jgi:hypothetical protein
LTRYTKSKAKAQAAGRELHTGGVVFLQRFGSALQLNPHFHILVPEGVWAEDVEGNIEWLPIEKPIEKEVESVLIKCMLALKRHMAKSEYESEADNTYANIQEDSASKPQQTVFEAFNEVPATKPKKKPLCANIEGFSLHADTSVHGHDRQGLFTLCYYGARGCYAKERLSQRDDGLYVYQVKRSAVGATELVLSARKLVRKIACLVPPARKHILRKAKKMRVVYQRETRRSCPR